MANDQGKNYGAFPIVDPQSPPVVQYFKANTAVNIFRGQFVAVNNSGQVQVIAPGDNVASCGVAWTFLDATRSGLPSAMTTLANSAGPYLPSGNDAQVGVIIDPTQLYLMEEITGGTALSAASLGQVVNFTYIATTGNTTTGFANSVIQNSSVSSGTGPLLQLMDIYNITNNDGTINAPGASCKWVVRIANHQFNGTKLSVPQG